MKTIGIQVGYMNDQESSLFGSLRNCRWTVEVLPNGKSLFEVRDWGWWYGLKK